MSYLRNKKMAFVLTIALICCFVFAGAAFAATNLTVYSDSKNPATGEYTNNFKADHDYSLNIELNDISVPLNNFCSDKKPADATNKLYVDFEFVDEDYNFDIAKDQVVNVVLDVNGTDYLVRVIPEIMEEEACGSVADRVYFTIERQRIPVSGLNAVVNNVKISGLKVTTPSTPDDNYNVCIGHTNAMCAIQACTNVRVVETVAKIELDAPEGCLYAGNVVQIGGTVYSTEPVECGSDELKPWSHTTWPVVIEIMQKITGYDDCDKKVVTYKNAINPSGENGVDECGNVTCVDPCVGEPIAAVIAHTDSNGEYKASIKLPACLYDEDGNAIEYIVRARTIEVQDENLDGAVEYFNDYVVSKDFVPAEAIEDLGNKKESADRNHIKRSVVAPAAKAHAWLQSDEDFINIIPGEPWTIKMSDLGQQIDCDGIYPVTICLTDKYCNVTPNMDPCGENREALKVELIALVDGTKSIVAGEFFDAEYGNKIVFTEILPGEECVTVWFKPTKTGVINLEASAIIGNQNRFAGDCNLEVNCDDCLLEATYLVVADGCELFDYNPPMAGWPVKVSVHYEDAGDLRVELLDPETREAVEWATWDTILYKTGYNLNYDADGTKVTGDYFTHPNLTGYTPLKSDFYVYVDACDAIGKSLIVKIVDEANRVHDEILIGEFVTPVELVRAMEPNGWQILSTPKTLAGDGNMKFLLGVEQNAANPYSDILTFKNGAWQQVSDSAQLQPLDAYYVNFKQNWCEDVCVECSGAEKPIYAAYVYDRITDPRGLTLTTKNLQQGWNFVGPSFNEEEISYKEAYTWFCSMDDYFYYDPCDAVCEENVPTFDGQINPYMLFQNDALYRMLGAACADCKVVINHGGSGLEAATFDTMPEYGNEWVDMFYGEELGDREDDTFFFGDPNTLANLAHFTTAAVSNGTQPAWANDPYYMAFNGDGYWVYVANSTQPIVAQAQLEMLENVQAQPIQLIPTLNDAK